MRRRTASSCPTCGSAVPSRARFCAECGTRLEAPAPTATAPLETPGAGPRRGRGEALARARARVRFAADSFATRSRAGRDIAAVRHEILALGEERERALRALGEVVYRDDGEGTNRVRAELAELDARIERKEAQMTTIAAEAHDRLARARLEVQPTEMVEIPEPPQPPGPPTPPEPPEPPRPPEPGPATVPEPFPQPVPEPYPPPDEATPPEPARIPEPGPLNTRSEK